MRADLQAVWYRFRATHRPRLRGYLTLVVLIGWIGGIALASVAAARRTQSSFATFRAHADASDLIALVAQRPAGPTDDTATMSLVDHLPGIRHAERAVEINGAPLGPDGAPMARGLSDVRQIGSVDGLYFHQDRLAVVRGRLADPQKSSELVMTGLAAQLLGLHVGDSIPWGFYTAAQINRPDFGSPSVTPALRRTMRLVGLVALDTDVVQDEADRLPAAIVFTPALTALLPPDAGSGAPTFTFYGAQLSGGSQDLATLEQAFEQAFTSGPAYISFYPMSAVETKVDRAVKPESIALGVFGGIAALAALVIAALTISRQLQAGAADRQVLRALGAGPATTVSDGLVGTLAATVVGSALAAGIAAALSPLSPLGPVRQVYRDHAMDFDWTVLGGGLLVVIAGLGLIAAGLSFRARPHRVAPGSRQAMTPGSRLVRYAAASGLPAPGMIGARFALEQGQGSTAVPARSALLGGVLTVAMFSATLTFGSGLSTLVAHPALYGWNWDFALNSNQAVPPQARALLQQDPAVAAWNGLFESSASIDGQDVPILMEEPHAEPAAPELSGHGLEGNDQLILGAATLAQLHKRVGDSVVATSGNPSAGAFYVAPTRLVIAGTATLPALGSIPGQNHTEMGIGALLPVSFWPPAFQAAVADPNPTLDGPALVLVRLRKGVGRPAALADLQRIADAANQAFAQVPNGAGLGDAVVVLPVQHPAEIANYRSVGTTPAILDAGLAAGAVIALALTLASSVRRRRRDLALLRTFGFTTGQLRATVAWQASIAAVIGVAAGIPLGIGLGRWLWVLFAHDIHAVALPTVPVGSLLLVAAGALIVANVVATLPASIAARTPTAALLRTE